MELIDAARVLGAAMTPIGELRFSIPYGMLALKGPWPAVFLLSVLGNMVPALVLLPLLDRIAAILQWRPNPLGKLLQWRLAHIQAHYSARFLRWGAPALVLLVAVPLPLTGAWTGTLVAWAFRVPYRLAIPLIFAGVMIAGAVVTIAVVLGGQAWQWLLAYRE